MKKILITGKNSYIGDSVRDYLLQDADKYIVDLKDTVGWIPEPWEFSSYDVVLNVAGIAHIKESEENRQKYYLVNEDLAVRIAKAAKEGGVKQLIQLSTMSVYGLAVGHITKKTVPHPVNAYGISKLLADKEIQTLADGKFKVVCLRPPMVYGKGCKGNYRRLRWVALQSLIFPNYKNKRSMIYIGNLCEFIKECIIQEREGLFFPQNECYVSTNEMVGQIAMNHAKKIHWTEIFNWAIRITPANVLKKVFGNLTYEKVDLVSKFGFEESIKLTEDSWDAF